MNRVLPAIIAIGLLVYAVIDLFQTEPNRVTSLNRGVWLAIIVLVPIIGPILWLTLAKRDWQARPKPAAAPPLPPDDNPEFLRQIKSLDDEHKEMLDDWESDLRRREEEMRRRAEGNGDDDSK